MKKVGFILVFLVFLSVLVACSAQDAENEIKEGTDKVKEEINVSETSQKCINCHEAYSPGIVADWRDSKHVNGNVGCFECHKANDDDKDVMEHQGEKIAILVTPQDCSRCHKTQVEQFSESLHAKGTTFVMAVPGVRDDDDVLGYEVEGQAAPLRGCEQCHGTVVKVKENGKLDPLTYPNAGIGRINPDGSKGSCVNCHTGHRFSKAEARKPYACSYCHLGPDHPQMDIYWESAHGSIFQAEGDTWTWDSPVNEWGREEHRAPTCATCHMSGLNGVKATHNASNRLSWELERPLSVHTENWEEERKAMQTICRTCHSEDLIKNMYTQADKTVELYNEGYYKPLTAIMDKLYEQKKLTKEKFDEEMEFKYFEMWHHEGRRARFGAFMNGPDFVQWHGFY